MVVVRLTDAILVMRVQFEWSCRLVVMVMLLFAGVVTIARLLDYDESPNRTFVVVAYDNGVPSLSSTATVFVQLSDINNYPPVFDPVSLRFHPVLCPVEQLSKSVSKKDVF